MTQPPYRFGRFIILKELTASDELGAIPVRRNNVCALARDPRRRLVLVERLNDNVVDPSVILQFENEIKERRKTKHRCLLPVREIGKYDGRPYCVFDWVAGNNIVNLMAAVRCPPALAGEIVLSVSSVLELVRSKPALHLRFSSIAAHDVFITHDGTIRLIEWGWRMSTDGSLRTIKAASHASFRVTYTLGAKAPEERDGYSGDIAADIFRLYKIFAFLCEGKLRDDLRERPPAYVSPNDPAALRTLGQLCERFNESERPQTWSMFRSALEATLTELPRRDMASTLQAMLHIELQRELADIEKWEELGGAALHLFKDKIPRRRLPIVLALLGATAVMLSSGYWFSHRSAVDSGRQGSVAAATTRVDVSPSVPPQDSSRESRSTVSNDAQQRPTPATAKRARPSAYECEQIAALGLRAYSQHNPPGIFAADARYARNCSTHDKSWRRLRTAAAQAYLWERDYEKAHHVLCEVYDRYRSDQEVLMGLTSLPGKQTCP